MIEQIDVMVGSETMTIQSLPATKALVLLGKLAKIAGGAGIGITDIPTKAADIEEALHPGKMLMGILDKIDPSEAQKLFQSILVGSLSKPNWADKTEAEFQEWYDGRFSRRIDELFILLTAIFIHNYGSPADWGKKIWGLMVKHGLVKPSDQSLEETPEESDTQDS